MGNWGGGIFMQLFKPHKHQILLEEWGNATVHMLGALFASHAIWHLFVIGGCSCHFWVIYHYVLPSVT